MLSKKTGSRRRFNSESGYCAISFVENKTSYLETYENHTLQYLKMRV